MLGRESGSAAGRRGALAGREAGLCESRDTSAPDGAGFGGSAPAPPSPCRAPTPAAPTSAPPAAPPARPWRHEPPAPPFDRGRTRAVAHGAPAAPPPRAPVACGVSTRRTRLASKLVLFQFWL